MTDLIPVSLQCYMGRYELSINSQMTIHDTLRFFRKSIPALGQVNMDAYVVNYAGKLLIDGNITLKEAKIAPESVLILVKKTSCPAANPNNEEGEEE